jgi:hypothetical protein
MDWVSVGAFRRKAVSKSDGKADEGLGRALGEDTWEQVDRSFPLPLSSAWWSLPPPHWTVPLLLNCQPLGQRGRGAKCWGKVRSQGKEL